MSDQTIPVKYLTSYELPTGKMHQLQLPPDWMTVTFLMPSGTIDIDYPKYVLKSTDGMYEKSLTAKDDMKPGDKYLQLKFEKLVQGKKYTLTVFDDADISRVIFKGIPYEDVVDQERSMHEDFVQHEYGAFEFGEVVDGMFPDLDGAA